MMTLVADANAALGTMLPGHDGRVSNIFLNHLSKGDLVYVPSLWLLEPLNVLLVRERRKKLDATERDLALSCIQGYPVQVDNESAVHIGSIQNLATKHSLSSYDATYLELAIRMKCPVLSADKALCEAARAEGLILL